VACGQQHLTSTASLSSTPSVTTTTAPARLDAAFDNGGLSFSYPAEWRPQSFLEVGSFFELITYLSTVTLHDPCTHPQPGMSICGDPIGTVPPGGVLVMWGNVGFPRTAGQPEVRNPNSTIGGQHARVTTDRPGLCGQFKAEETITADIERPGGNHYEMQACLRSPNLSLSEQRVQAMLTSTRVSS
jgi:hypothetical protein